jgi:hypothetical protein
MTDPAISPAAIEAVAELLAASEKTMIGLTFIPDPEGWEVGYFTVEQGGGGLANGYSLEAAARGALRPFFEIATQFEGRD